MEEADNGRIESEFRICRAGGAGKELRVLWKISLSCGRTMGRDVGAVRKGLMHWEESKGSRSIQIILLLLASGDQLEVNRLLAGV